VAGNRRDAGDAGAAGTVRRGGDTSAMVVLLFLLRSGQDRARSVHSNGSCVRRRASVRPNVRVLAVPLHDNDMPRSSGHGRTLIPHALGSIPILSS
jgi:hypothetical protein